MLDRVAGVIWQISWPPAAPIAATAPGHARWWTWASVLLVLPFTAALHHAVFYRPTCILNNFGPDYHAPGVLVEWLSRDPSLAWAIALALAVHAVGKRHAAVRWLAAPIFPALLPLTLWIWDIPFSGRVICDHFHDQKAMLFGDVALRTRYLYYLGGAVYLAFLARLVALGARRDTSL